MKLQMNVQKIKRYFKPIIGVVGLLGSTANVCIANLYCFDKGQYIVGFVWFLFGFCAIYACVDYIFEKRYTNV